MIEEEGFRLPTNMVVVISIGMSLLGVVIGISLCDLGVFG